MKDDKKVGEVLMDEIHGRRYTGSLAVVNVDRTVERERWRWSIYYSELVMLERDNDGVIMKM